MAAPGWRRSTAAFFLSVLGLTGCAWLRPAPESPRLYLLEGPDFRAASPAPDARAVHVTPPLARPGFDTPRMLYVQREYELESFAHSRWVDAPARMLEPLLVGVLEQEPRLRVVREATGAALELDTELLVLQHEFTTRPSAVRLVLRAELSDGESRRTIETRVFEVVEPAPSEDPYGGVVAANRAVERALDDLRTWLLVAP